MFKEKGGPLVLEEVETPMPGAGEILITVLVTGICRSDTMSQYQYLGGPL